MNILRIFYYCLFAILVLNHPIRAEIINVPDDFETIQAGIDESENGDTVLVQPGEYVENLTIPFKHIHIASLYIFENNEEIIDETIIDGNDDGSTVEFQNTGNAELVFQGFTIRGGSEGGINCVYSSPTLRNLDVVDNSGGNAAGGIQFYESNAVLENSRISGNTADLGGGIHISGSEVTISGCIIENNDAGSGGGILMAGSTGLIIDTILRRNFAEYAGGGMRIESSVMSTFKCRIKTR